MPRVERRLAYTIPLTLVHEGEQAMRICNACRYCEGFCAVFPALERRRTFTEQDLVYLANLCHNCGECYYACQYAPPHEFGLNIPATLAAIRQASFRKHAWPGAFAGLFDRNRATLLLASIVAPAVFLGGLGWFAGATAFLSPYADAEGAFYGVMPHTVMVAAFGVIGLMASAPMVAGVFSFWRDIGEPPGALLDGRALARAMSDAMTLRYLDGAGGGCAYPADVPSQIRRRFHHATFYGFLLCFAATTVAAVYHNVLGWHAPYAVSSVPVVLGSAGGAGLIVGPVGLLWLKMFRNKALTDPAERGMDVAFLVLLLLTSVSGFLLLLLRESAAMGVSLAVHLGLVAGLFFTMPYGKFVHGIYRSLALLRNAIEAERR